MKPQLRNIGVLGLACLLAGARPASAQSATAGGLSVSEGEVVLFLGDELIDAPDPRTSSNFPFLVETFLAVRYSELNARFIHSGWSGDTVARALLRLERDVLSRKPTLVVVCLGLNDPEYAPFSDERLAAFKRDLAVLVDRLSKAGARVWVISPPSVREEPGRTTRLQRGGSFSVVDLQGIQYNATLARYAAAAGEVAAATRAGFVDWYGPSLHPRQGGQVTSSYGRDGRLPPAESHALIAAELLEAWGAAPVQIAVEVRWSERAARLWVGGGPPRELPLQISEKGGWRLELSGLPIPWPMPGGRAGAMRPDWSASRMCQLVLRVDGAPARGVRIEAVSGAAGPAQAAVFSADELAAGINLAASEILRSLPESRDLLLNIGLKNYYQISTWRRQELNPPAEPELADAHRRLVDALNAYATGYEQIIRGLPRRCDTSLILSEATPDERVPTAALIARTRPASRPATRPASRPS